MIKPPSTEGGFFISTIRAPISAIQLIENVYNSAMTLSVKEFINDKLGAITSSDAAIPASSNIGCNLHIANGLREKNLAVSVMHPIQIIAGQMGFTGNI